MPFIPPAASNGHPRSACGLGPGGENMQTKCLSLPATAFNKTKASADKNCNSVKERFALNLRHLGRKSRPKSRLPTVKVVAAPGLHVKSRDQWSPSSTVFSGVSHHTPSMAGEATTCPLSRVTYRWTAGLCARKRLVLHWSWHWKAVHLLQRRSTERKQHTANSTKTGGHEQGIRVWKE